MNTSELRGKAFSSIVWKMLERIGAQLVSLVVSITIARLLDPSDYGVVSLVTIFFSFANVIISNGFNTALIQKKEADKKDYSTVFTITIVFSVIIYIVLFLLAPSIATLYNQPLLIPIIRVMGITIIINGVKSVVCAYVSSTLQFKKFFYATLGGTIGSGLVGIAMAYKGFGAWALVLQQMINSFIDTIILIIVTHYKFSFYFSFSRAKALFSYGWKILVSALINTTYNQIRPLVIGIKFTAADLSFYSKGESFPQLITSTTTDTLSAVLFPVMSKIQDDKELLLKYTRLFIKVASFLVFPLMLGLFAVADNMICVLLSDKWLSSSFYVKIFAISGMFSMINTGNCETIKAMGKSDVFLVMEIIKKASYFAIVGFFILFSNSPEFLAASSLLCTIVAIIVNTVPNRKLLNYTYIKQITDILPNLVTSVIMCIAVYYIGKMITNQLLALSIQIIIGVLIYITLNVLIKNENIIYIYNMVKGYRGK